MRKKTIMIGILKILLILVIICQQSILTLNINFNKLFICLIDLILIPFFIYIFINFLNDTQIYMLYIYAIVVKVSILYFFSLPKYIRDTNLDIDSKWINDFTYKIFSVTFGILLFTIFYLLLCVIKHTNLYNIHSISTDKILLFFIVIHVSIDFIDIAEFFFSCYFYFTINFLILKNQNIFFDHIKLLQDTHKIDILNRLNNSEKSKTSIYLQQAAFIICGVLICLNISLHAYSLPIHSYKQNINQVTYTEENINNQITYKDENKFLDSDYSKQNIDIHNSFLNINSNNLYNNVQKNKFNFKNKNNNSLKMAGDMMSCLKYISIYSFILTDICFFCFRFFIFCIFSNVLTNNVFMIKNLCFIIIHTNKLYNASKYIFTYTNEYLKRKKQMKKNEKKQIKKNNKINGLNKKDKKNTNKEDLNNMNLMYSLNKSLKNSTLNTKIFTNSVFSNEIIDINDIMKSEYRITDLNNKKIKFYYYYLYLKYNRILYFKKNVAIYLDDIEIDSVKVFLIFFFYILLLSIKITIIIFLYVFNYDNFKYALHQFLCFGQFNAINSNIALKLIFIFFLIYDLSILLVYLFTCSIFDSIFMAIYYFFNINSFLLAIVILYETPFITFDLFNYNSDKNCVILFILFCYLIYMFLSDSYIFIYLLLGRKMITCKINDKQKNFYQIENTTEKDTIVVSVISILVFKLMKFMKAPLILNTIIIGNNLTKNSRLNNFLLYCHFKEIIIKSIIYLVCIQIILHDEDKNVLYVSFFFLTHLFISMLYLIIAKNLRNGAMNYIFLKSIFKELNNDMKKGSSHFNNKKHHEYFCYDYEILTNNNLNIF